MQKPKKIQRKLIEIDSTELRRIQARGVKVLAVFNEFRGIVSKVVKDLPRDFNESYKAYCDYMLKGYPEGVNIEFASKSKGFENDFNQVKNYYNQIKELEIKSPEYFQHLELDNGQMKFNKSIEDFYNKNAGVFLEGEKAINIHNKIKAFLEAYDVLYSEVPGLILANRLMLVQALPMLLRNNYGTLDPNVSAINSL